MSAPINSTLEALERARAEHQLRQELRRCRSCVNLWPDGTCRLEGPKPNRDGIAVYPKSDGLGCNKWDPIFGPGKTRYGSAITEADRVFSEFYFEAPSATTNQGRQLLTEDYQDQPNEED